MMPAGGGSTIGAHERQLAKHRGLDTDDLPFPHDCKFVWETFCHLHGARSFGASMPNPLSWTDIHNWCELYGINLESWELDAIKVLDGVFLEVATNARPSRTTPKNKKPRSGSGKQPPQRPRRIR